MAKRASIDIGSNSCLLLVAEVSGGKLDILFRDQNVTALGRDLDKNGHFHEESKKDTYDVLKKYALKVREFGLEPSDVIVTATEASRVATDAAEFFYSIEKDLGFKFTIITGEAEAYYSSLGAMLDQKDKYDSMTIMDIGGASTELIKVNSNPFEIVDFVSLPIGSVRVTNWRNENIIDAKIEELLQKYKEIISKFETESLLCVAGTMTSIANMELKNKEFIEKEVHNHHFPTQSLSKIVEKYHNYSEDDFLKDFPFLGKRAKAISGGIFVADFLCGKLKVKDIYVSTYGLMFGTALEGEIKDEFRN